MLGTGKMLRISQAFAIILAALPGILTDSLSQFDDAAMKLVNRDIGSGRCQGCMSLVRYANEELSNLDRKIIELKNQLKNQTAEEKEILKSEDAKIVAKTRIEKARADLKMKERTSIDWQLNIEKVTQKIVLLNAEGQVKARARAKESAELRKLSDDCEMKKTDTLIENGELIETLSRNSFKLSGLFDALMKCQHIKNVLDEKLSSTSKDLLNKLFNLFEALNKKRGNILGLGLFNELYSSNTAGPDWMAILRREDDTDDFNRSWEEYVNGFGDLKKGFWFGLEKIYKMTKERRYELFVEVIDANRTEHFAKYDNFTIGGLFEKYALTSLGNFTGNIYDLLSSQVGKPFSTHDYNHAGLTQCPKQIKTGWWHADCEPTNLAGNKLKCDPDSFTELKDCVLNQKSDFQIYPLKRVQMLIRPFKSYS